MNEAPHSAVNRYNGTAIRHAPAMIYANKSKDAKWGTSGHWIINASFGMSVEYLRADIAAAQVEALTKELDEARSEIASNLLPMIDADALIIGQAGADQATLRALLREAREALLPLARECETYSDNAPEDTDTTVCDWDTAPLTLGDLRRARAVLAKLEALK